MFVLIVGCGRVGSAIARTMLAEGHEVSVLDEDPEAIAQLEKGQHRAGRTSAGRSPSGTALEIDALLEAGIDRADAFVASTDGDNTNLVIAQIAQRRFNVPTVVVRVLDPARAKWYEEQGLKTVCPTQIAIDMLEDAVEGSRCGLMYVIVVGAGKVGLNLARELIDKGNELTIIEGDARRYATVEEELEHRAQYGDGSELWVLERGRHRARRHGDRRHRRRRGQHPDLPGRAREVRRRARDRALQQPAQPPALRAARRQARRLGHRPDPAPDRARGAALRAAAPARPAAGAARDHRGRGAPTGRPPTAAWSATSASPRARSSSRSCATATGFVPPADSVIEAGDEVLLVLDTGLEDKVTERFARVARERHLTPLATRSVDYLLIGGGVAAASCAEALREEGADGSIVVVGREADPPYKRPPLSKGYLAGSGVARGRAVQARRRGGRRTTSSCSSRKSVMKLDPDERVAKLPGDESIRFGKALLATGANVRRLRVDGTDIDGDPLPARVRRTRTRSARTPPRPSASC